jgi:hypothetical protein
MNKIWNYIQSEVYLYCRPAIWLWKKIRGTELKPCPQCGGKARILQNIFENRYRVQCKSCKTFGKSSCVKEVAKIYWNDSDLFK